LHASKIEFNSPNNKSIRSSSSQLSFIKSYAV
jgi:hypothetical protein